MSTDSTQISAIISVETKERMERYVRAFGVKKSHLIESALLHHLAALEEIPADVMVPPRLVVTQDSGKRIQELVTNPPPPTEAMKALFDDRDSSSPTRG